MSDMNVNENQQRRDNMLKLLKDADSKASYGNMMQKQDDIFLNTEAEKEYVKLHYAEYGFDKTDLSLILSATERDNTGVIVEKNYTQIFGLEEAKSEDKSTTKSANQPEIVFNQSVKTLGSKKQDKLAQNNILRNLSLDKTAFQNAMSNEIYSNKNYKGQLDYYKNLQYVAQTVLDAVNSQQITNKKDIEKAYKTVKKALEEPFKDFKLDVLKKVIDMKEDAQKAIEYQKMHTEYETKTNSGISRKKAVKQTKKEFDGSYYDELGSQLKKEAKVDANKAYADEQENLTGKNVENYRKVTNTAYDNMKDKSYVKKHNLSTYGIIRGEESSNKLRSKAVAAENRVNARRTKLYTDKEFLDVLKNDDILTGLKNVKLITIDENDSTKFKLTALSDLIGKYVGADFIASTQRDGKELMSEVENIRTELESQTGLNVSTKDAIRLIKMCGYDTYSKNYKKALSDAFLGTIPGLAGSAAGITAMMSLLNTQWLDSIIPIEVNADKSVAITVKITVKGNVNVKDIIDKKQLFNGLGEEYIDYSSIKYEGNSLILSIKKDALEKFNMDVKVKDAVAKSPNKGADWLKAFGVAALSQLAVQALIAILSAKPNTENPILHTQFDYTDVEDYKKHLLDTNQYLSESEKTQIYELAKQFKKEDGSWDAEAFKKVLDASFAGTQSFLSGLELERGLRKKGSNAESITIDHSKGNAQSAAQATTNNKNAQDVDNDCEVKKEEKSKLRIKDIPLRTGSWYIANGYVHEDGSALSQNEIGQLMELLDTKYGRNDKNEKVLLVKPEIELSNGKKVKLADDAVARIKKLPAKSGGKDPNYKRGEGTKYSKSCDGGKTWNETTKEDYEEYTKRKKK